MGWGGFVRVVVCVWFCSCCVVCVFDLFLFLQEALTPLGRHLAALPVEISNASYLTTDGGWGLTLTTNPPLLGGGGVPLTLALILLLFLFSQEALTPLGRHLAALLVEIDRLISKH